MRTNKKLSILGAGFVFSFIVIAALAYSNWVLQKEVNQFRSERHWSGQKSASLQPSMQQKEQRWGSIWGDFNAIQGDLSQIDSWMNSMMGDMLTGHSPFSQSHFNPLFQGPSIEFEEGENAYKVVIEKLVGEEIELNTEVSDGVLTVTGRVKRALPEVENTQYSQSIFSSEFSRTYYLDEPVDQSAMNVSSEVGKTIVHLPKLIG